MENTEQQIAAFLMPFSPEIRAFAQALRTYLTEAKTQALELMAEGEDALHGVRTVLKRGRATKK